jgi:hypothetical protein
MHRTVVAVASLVLALTITAPVLAQSPPPYPEDADVTFEPVGPSAWRVMEPDLDCEREPFFGATDTAVAPDGRVWLLDPVMGLRQLGSCPVPVEGGRGRFLPRDQALAPDGTLWLLDGDRLLSWADGEWTVRLEGEFNVPACTFGDEPITYEEWEERGGSCRLDEPFYLYLDIAPDGSVWLGGAGRLGVYGEEGWREYAEEWMANLLFRPGFGPDGAVWYGPYVFYP